MSDDRRGLLWPLALIFLLTLCGGFIGLVAPKLFGSETDRTIAGWLIAAAVLSGLVLYFPRILLAAKVTDLGDISTSLLGNQGIQYKLGNLSTQVTNLNSRLDTPNGDVRADIQAVKTLLDTGAVHASLDTIAGQLATSGDVRKLLNDANTKLDSIKTKLGA